MFLKASLAHVLAFFTALGLIVLLLFVIKTQSREIAETHIIHGNQNRTRGLFPNLTDGEETELQYVASIQNKDGVTLFGSSEFSVSPYSSYFFLPDTLGIPALGIGHAYHQCFSIMCELLAVYDDLEGANICIILSPSWFHTAGTNTEAFAEFVRPNFLAQIANNENIPGKYKLAIGRYIALHAEEFTALSKNMEFFVDEYKFFKGSKLAGRLRSFMKGIHPSVFEVERVEYQVDSLITLDTKTWNVDKESYLEKLQQTFLSSITTNKIYVYDDYYQQYILSPEGIPRKDSINPLVFENNAEFEDFKLLVDLLAARKANCSFVFQPVNTYHYKYAENNQPLVDSITTILGKYQMPLLNMYASDTASYKPGSLRDVMHLGDYGWMEINFFLDSIYHER